MFGFMKHARDFKGYKHALDLLIPSIAVTLVMPSYLRLLLVLTGIMMPTVRKALQALKLIEKEAETWLSCSVYTRII